MSNYLLTLLKLSITALYAVVVGAWLFDYLLPYQMILNYLVIFLLIAHLAEFLWLKNKFIALGKGQSKHFIYTLLFGFVYWLPLFKKAQSPS